MAVFLFLPHLHSLRRQGIRAPFVMRGKVFVRPRRQAELGHHVARMGNTVSLRDALSALTHLPPDCVILGLAPNNVSYFCTISPAHLRSTGLAAEGPSGSFVIRRSMALCLVADGIQAAVNACGSGWLCKSRASATSPRRMHAISTLKDRATSP